MNLKEIFELPPLIVNFAPTGMTANRELTPHIPIRPDEIIRDVLHASDIGITMVHLHARESDGRPTFKKDVYAKIISGIREHRPDLIICVSCSGRNFKDLNERAEVLNLGQDLRPDMASLTLSSMNFARQESINSPQTVRTLALMMLERGITPEFEVFDLGMANFLSYLVDKLGLVSPYYANIILGNIASAQADLLSIAALTNALPGGTIWGLGGIGNAQIHTTMLAASFAPAVRVGLEDNLWLDRKRARPATNIDMIERVHHLASLADRKIMDSGTLRDLLHFRKI